MAGFVSDSVAALMAAGAEKVGEAASSLGSTLAIDLLSSQPIDAARFGICSYRWKNHWIVGGHKLDQKQTVSFLLAFAPIP